MDPAARLAFSRLDLVLPDWCRFVCIKCNTQQVREWHKGEFGGWVEYRRLYLRVPVGRLDELYRDLCDQCHRQRDPKPLGLPWEPPARGPGR